MGLTRIHWLYPNLAWRLDDTERHGKCHGLRAIQDAASRYKFPPLAGLLSRGEKVAQHLEKLLGQYGTPLFLKQDNGSIEHTQGDYQRRVHARSC